MARVVFFPTCIVDSVRPEAGLSACRLIEQLGFEVDVPEESACCGQPAWNAGHSGPAADVARTTLRALTAAEGDIVVPAGSCATMIRVFWRELFEIEGSEEERELAESVASRTYELSEFLQRSGLRAEADPTPVVYHRSCHMLRELGIDTAPEELLEAAGADLRVSEASDRCCGFGGLFSVKLPELSTTMADAVLDAYVASGAEQVVGCDASCLMHLEGRASRRGLPLAFRHLAEVLDTEPQP